MSDDDKNKVEQDEDKVEEDDDKSADLGASDGW
jgi:hypothetical protein